MSIDNLTVKQLRERLAEADEIRGVLRATDVAQAEDKWIYPATHDDHWQIGKNYFIRTVTHHHTGRLVKITPTELVLEDAAWIADDGRFADAMATGALNEIEPWPDGAQVIIGRGALIDAVLWSHALPREQK